MNIPLGTPFISVKELTTDVVVKDIANFMDAKRTGYFCIMTKGSTGMEEGLLVVESGNIVGVHYEYLRYGMQYTAGEALKRVANSVYATHGVYDAFELTNQQLELLKIFNEGILLLESVPLRSFEGSIPVKFAQEYEDAIVKEATSEQDRTDVLKDTRIGDIKVDNYDQLKRDVDRGAKKPELADKVAAEMSAYLSGAPPVEEPKEPLPPDEAVISSTPLPPPPPDFNNKDVQKEGAPAGKGPIDLGSLDSQAEKLLKDKKGGDQ